MKLVLLTALTMIAFAANSVLNRMGLVQAEMDPVSFGTIRLIAGAGMLALLCLVFRGGVTLAGPRRAAGVLTLTLYIYGFSLAYVALDAGLGALLLFGTVQVTMFAGAILAKDPMPPLRWAGAGLAFAGLVWLLLPTSDVSVPLAQAGMMVLAGVGWGLYSLVGRNAGDAMQATAANFILAVPLGIALAVVSWGIGPGPVITSSGVWLAILSGAVTSGVGYALWYSILPQLGSARAAVAQLSVPVIAIAGGALLLSEVPDLRTLIAGAVVLGGVALSLRAK
ncbi:MAG: DMT family transporter [Thalassovita sp.]